MKDEINQILVQTLHKQSELEANAAELEVTWPPFVLVDLTGMKLDRL